MKIRKVRLRLIVARSYNFQTQRSGEDNRQPKITEGVKIFDNQIIDQQTAVIELELLVHLAPRHGVFGSSPARMM